MSLVGLPTAAGHQHLASVDELLYLAEPFGRLGDEVDLVETGVAGDGALLDAMLLQQIYRLLVLDKEVVEAMQLSKEPFPIPTEEILTRTEDGAEQVGGTTAALQLLHVVEPEVVFDEEGYLRLDGLHPAAGVATAVHRKVKDMVGMGIVLPHLVARGREKGDDDGVVAVLLLVLLQHGSGLLELAHRRGVEPNGVLVSGPMAQLLLRVFPPLNHQTGFFVPKAGQSDAEGVDGDGEGVEQTHGGMSLGINSRNSRRWDDPSRGTSR